MDITAENTFTPAVLVQGGDKFDVSLEGTFVATVWLQRSKDATTWYDVESFTAPTEQTGDAGSQWYYRLGVKTGGYTSGTVKANLYS